MSDHGQRAFLENPAHVAEPLYDDLLAVTGPPSGIRLNHPKHPGFVALTPRPGGEFNVQPFIGTATPTFARASTAYVWDGWADLFQLVNSTGVNAQFLADDTHAARIHGARLHHNHIELDANLSGTGAATVTVNADGTKTVSGITARADTVISSISGVSNPVLSDLEGRRFFTAAKIRASSSADVGKLCRLTCKREQGGAVSNETFIEFRLTAEFRRYGFLCKAGLSGNAGLVVQLGGTDSNAASSLDFDEMYCYEVTHACDDDAAKLWSVPVPGGAISGLPVAFEYVPPAENRWYWKTPRHTLQKNDSHIVTAPTGGINLYGRIDDVGDVGAELHPTSYVDGILVFSLFDVAKRSTAYVVGDHRLPDGLRPFNDGAGGAAYSQLPVYLECVTAGTTHASSTVNGSTWNITGDPIGQLLTDGTVVWRVAGRYTRHGVIGYQCESASTNDFGDGATLFDTRDVTTSDWDNLAGGATITGARGIDGIVQNISLEDANAVAAEAEYETATVVADSIVTASVFLKKRELSSDYPGVMLLNNSGTLREAPFIHPGTGAIPGATHTAGTTYVEDWGAWWRIICVLDIGALDTAVQWRLFPARSTNGTAEVSSAQGTTIFDFPMVEDEATYATSPIWNAGAETTRVRDELDYASSWTSLLDSSECIGVVTACMHGESENANTTPRIAEHGNTGDIWYYHKNNNGWLWDIGAVTHITGSPATVAYLEGIAVIGGGTSSAVSGQHVAQRIAFHQSIAQAISSIDATLGGASSNKDPGADTWFTSGALQIGQGGSVSNRNFQGVLSGLVYWGAGVVKDAANVLSALVS